MTELLFTLALLACPVGMGCRFELRTSPGVHQLMC